MGAPVFDASRGGGQRIIPHPRPSFFFFFFALLSKDYPPPSSLLFGGPPLAKDYPPPRPSFRGGPPSEASTGGGQKIIPHPCPSFFLGGPARQRLSPILVPTSQGAPARERLSHLLGALVCSFHGEVKRLSPTRVPPFLGGPPVKDYPPPSSLLFRGPALVKDYPPCLSLFWWGPLSEASTGRTIPHHCPSFFGGGVARRRLSPVSVLLVRGPCWCKILSHSCPCLVVLCGRGGPSSLACLDVSSHG